MLSQLESNQAEEIQRLRQELYSLNREYRQKVLSLEQKNETLTNCWQQAVRNTEEAQKRELRSRQRIKVLEATLEQTLALEPQVKLLQAEVLKLRAHLNPPIYSNVGAVVK